MTGLINSAQAAKCTKEGEICCAKQYIAKTEFSIDKPAPTDYENDDANQCEIFFAGKGTSFGSFNITQDVKEEFLTYE